VHSFRDLRIADVRHHAGPPGLRKPPGGTGLISHV